MHHQTIFIINAIQPFLYITITVRNERHRRTQTSNIYADERSETTNYWPSLFSRQISFLSIDNYMC